MVFNTDIGSVDWSFKLRL